MLGPWFNICRRKVKTEAGGSFAAAARKGTDRSTLLVSDVAMPEVVRLVVQNLATLAAARFLGSAGHSRDAGASTT